MVELGLNEVETLYEFWKEGKDDEHYRYLKNRGVFLPGPLIKVVPEAGELEAIIEDQLNNCIPRKFILEVTENCTLRCKYCLFSSLENIPRKHSFKEMTLDTAYEAIHFYYKLYTNGISQVSPSKLKETLKLTPPTISWWGGEPLMNFELIKATQNYFENLPWQDIGIKTSDIVYSLVTNFTVINNDIIKFLVDNKVFLFISLDGGRNEHDTNRVYSGGKGSFDNVVRNIDSLILNNPDYCRERVTIQAVIAENTDEHQTRLFLSDYFKIDTPYRKVLNCLTYYEKKEKRYLSNKQIKNIEHLDEAEFDANLRQFELLDKATIYNLLENVNLHRSEFRKLVDLEENFTFDDPYGTNYHSRLFSCPIGRDAIFVSCEGNLHICPKADYSVQIGNVKNGVDKNALYNLYSKYYNGLKDKCINCWAFRFCNICPALTLNKNEFYYPTEKECNVIKKIICRDITRYLKFHKHEKLYENVLSFFQQEKQENIFLNNSNPQYINKL